ncbi:MAG: hypothetical protein WCK77_24140 [Verrucomicrobiota bacterium]
MNLRLFLAGSTALAAAAIKPAATPAIGSACPPGISPAVAIQ